MSEITPEVLQLGAVAIIFLFCAKEFFAYLKQKKNGGTVESHLLKELQTTNQNHLGHIQECIERGNRELINTIHDDNSKIIELLGRIDGKLSK